MSFFINDAWAEAQAPSGLETGLNFLLPIALILVFYFLLLRPQFKRDKEKKKMVAALAKGDEIITTGGLLGKIGQIDDSFIGLDVAENVRIKVQRAAVASIVPKGTLKAS